MIQNLKTCSKCKKEKPLTEFRYSGTKKRKPHYCSWCKECEREYGREYQRRRWKNKHNECLEMQREVVKERLLKEPDYKRNNHLKYTYGITIDDYNKIFNMQNGRCAICKKHQSNLERPLFVDHNHTTGKIRGLLCPNCNRLIGWIESYNLLSSVTEYIRNYDE